MLSIVSLPYYSLLEKINLKKKKFIPGSPVSLYDSMGRWVSQLKCNNASRQWKAEVFPMGKLIFEFNSVRENRGKLNMHSSMNTGQNFDKSSDNQKLGKIRTLLIRQYRLDMSSIFLELIVNVTILWLLAICMHCKWAWKNRTPVWPSVNFI